MIKALIGEITKLAITAEGGEKPSPAFTNDWFAWYPVRTDQGWTWLETVIRETYWFGSCSETDVDWYEYRKK